LAIETRRSELNRALEVGKIALAFIGVLTTVMTFVLTRLPKHTQLTGQVLSVEDIRLPVIPDTLSGTYTIYDADIPYLWKVRAKFSNTGDMTLVGKGPIANIVEENLHFEFPAATRLMNFMPELNQVEASVTVYEKRKFRLRFDQWRVGEHFIGSFILGSMGNQESLHWLTAPGRQIIDGELRIEDRPLPDRPQNESYLTLLPRPLVIFVRLFGIFSLIVVAGFIIMWELIVEPYRYLRWRRWRAQLWLPFEKYINTLTDFDKRTRAIWLQHPEFLDREHWAEFRSRYEGEKCPVERRSAGDTVMLYVIASIVAFLLLALALDLLPI
jgi:hypothetical protein